MFHVFTLLNLHIGQSKKAKNSKIGIVLIHDGVIGISNKGKIPNHMEELLDLNIGMFAMVPDLKARGISLEYISEKIELIEYDDLIDILDTTPKVISWI